MLTIVGVGVVLGLVAYGAYHLMVGQNVVRTENAYVGADTAQVTPLIDAPVLNVLVKETQSVKAGDLLVELDPADARLALARARAELARADAELARARIDLGRRRALAPEAVSADELTTAQASHAAAIAMRAAALAQVETARLALTRTRILSPVTGVVSDKSVQVGQRVEAGRPLMIIAPLDSAFVDANFKEGQLRKVAVGQKVTLKSDLYGDKVVYHGTVTGFSGGTGSAFSLIPAQNASGNWIKVVQRVPVRIALDPEELRAHPLRVGMSMTAAVDVKAE